MTSKITCAGTDIVESLIIQGDSFEIQYIEDGVYKTVEDRLVDLITENGIEIIITSSGDYIEADNTVFIGPHYINNPLDDKIDRLVKVLHDNQTERPLVPRALKDIADISMAGKDIGDEDPDQWVKRQLVDGHAKGGYGEKRDMYVKSELFGSSDRRTIHLGIDVWTPARTPVLAPLDGTIHSFQNNDNFGDYGPTIILEHELDGVTFYTLHGHLTVDSLEGISEGQEVKQGEEFALIGDYHENGDWYPHVHTNVIVDMLGKKGDFSGVAKEREASFWMSVCINPQYLFNY